MKLWLSDVLVRAIRFYEQQLGFKYKIGVIDSQNTLGEMLADAETQEFLRRKMDRYMNDDSDGLHTMADEPILKEGAYK